MRKLFMTDIHGCYLEMVSLLAAAGFDARVDQLVIGGDMIDRGPDSGMVLNFIKTLQDTYPEHVKVIMGNHEEMMGWYLAGKNDMWLDHGGMEAMQSFEDVFKTQEELEEHLAWAITRPVIEMDPEYVYVHAGFIPGIPLHQQNRNQVLWMPYASGNWRFDRDFAPETVLKATHGRKAVFGHTPKSYIFDNGGQIGCDLGAAVKEKGAKLALVDLTAGRYWYYDFDTKQIKKRTISQGGNTSAIIE